MSCSLRHERRESCGQQRGKLPPSSLFESHDVRQILRATRGAFVREQVVEREDGDPQISDIEHVHSQQGILGVDTISGA